MSIFRRVLSRANRERIDREAAEVSRLSQLPDRFLARALLDLSRKAFEALPDRFRTPEVVGYEALLVRAVMPRLALALGETGLTREERSLLPLCPSQGPELRCFVGTCLGNQDLLRIGLREGSDTLAFLGRDFVNGHPATIALDRIAPPLPDSRDWIARHMREISRARFGHGEFLVWTPGFQDFGGESRRIPGAGRQGSSDPAPERSSTPLIRHEDIPSGMF